MDIAREVASRFRFKRLAAAQAVNAALQIAQEQRLTTRQRDALIAKMLKPIEDDEHRRAIAYEREAGDPRGMRGRVRRAGDQDLEQQPGYMRAFFENARRRAQEQGSPSSASSTSEQEEEESGDDGRYTVNLVSESESGDESERDVPVISSIASTLVSQMELHGNKFEVHAHSMDRLQPRVWLNDEIMNYFFALIQQRNEQELHKRIEVPRIICVDTYVYTKLMEKRQNVPTYDFTRVQRWFRRINYPSLFHYDQIFMPVNKGDFHWILVVVDKAARRIVAYDSFGDECLPILRNVKRFLEDKWRDDGFAGELPPYSLGFGRSRPAMPRQTNSYDCGVFTCMFGDYLSELRPLTFTQNDIPAYRLFMRRCIETSELPSRLRTPPPLPPAVYSPRRSPRRSPSGADAEARASYEAVLRANELVAQRQAQVGSAAAAVREAQALMKQLRDLGIASSASAPGEGATGYLAALQALGEAEVDTDVDEAGLQAYLNELERERSPPPRSFEFQPDPSVDPLGNPVLGLWEDIPRASDDIIRELVVSKQHRRNIFVNEPGSGFSEGARTICGVYSSEGYDCMIQDKLRNKAYEQGIASAPAKHWLEIGPGPALTLTQMVWRQHKDADVVAVEVNAESAKLAQKQARDKGWARKLKLIQGYSTSPEVRAALVEEEPFGAVLQEILGVIASSEGVVPVIGNLRATLRRSRPVFVPRYVATFFTLSHVDVPDLVTSVRAAHVNIEERTVMTQHLPFKAVDPVQPFRSKKPTFPGILEFIDLANIKPLEDATANQLEYELQEHEHEFTSDVQVVVNSLSTFVWAGFGGERPMFARRGASTTLFPYGIDDADLRDAAAKIGASFSTYSEDEALSRAWKNLVLVLKQPLTLRPGSIIRVLAKSFMGAVENGEPKPKYQFVVEYEVDGSVTDRTVYNVTNLYPSFDALTQLNKEAVQAVEARLPYRRPFEIGLPDWTDPSRSPVLAFSRSRSRTRSPRSASSGGPVDWGSDDAGWGEDEEEADEDEWDTEAQLSVEEQMRKEAEERRRKQRDAALLRQYEQVEAAAQRSAERKGRLYEEMAEQQRLLKLQARVLAEEKAARDEEMAAEVDAYEAGEAAEHAQGQQWAHDVGATYGVACTRRKKAVCADKDGCQWFVGKGCKPDTFVPAGPPAPRGTGCSKSPKALCCQNNNCKWKKYAGCRVRKYGDTENDC